MYLCIDIGNTRTKVGVFDDRGVIVLAETVEGEELEFFQKIISENSVHHVITSATGKRNWNPSELQVSGLNIELDHETPLPIKIIYSTPETLGRDRIAASCGVHNLYPEKNCLVIDAGTCITMDMVLKTGTYLGGNIGPGLAMRLKAMHEYTARLPLVEMEWPVLKFGDSTTHALQNGACLGALLEIKGILQLAKDAFGDVFVVMTGGDAAFLATQLESEIFVEPELVVKGLFKILSFNVEQPY